MQLVCLYVFLQDSFGKLIGRIMEHYENMRIEKARLRLNMFRFEIDARNRVSQIH